ncbi:MAG: hypothetical protein WCD89_02530 [Anaerocolumna sp.]
MVGVSLGICCYFKLKKMITIAASSAVLTVALGIMNFGIGFPVLGVPIPGVIIVQLVILLVFSIIYNFVYMIFADFIYKKIRSSGITDIGANGK